MKPVLVSLFDHSGVWSAPWADTHEVARVDIQDGRDVLSVRPEDFRGVDVVLAAPPCTHFTVASTRLWPTYDEDGRTKHSVQLVEHTLYLVGQWLPRVWALENPAGGRLRRLVPLLETLPRDVWHPWYFAGWADDPAAEAYRKRTAIYGRFVPPWRRRLSPEDVSVKGQTKISLMAPGPERANMRSQTPQGFARAFHAANARW